MSKLGIKILRMISIISLASMTLLILLNLVVFKVAFTRLQNDVKSKAVEASKIIDAGKLEKVMQANSMDTPEYKEIEEEMIKFKSDSDLRYFYTLAKGEKDSTYFLVDCALKDKSELGEEYQLEEEMSKAFDGTAAYTNKPYTDEFGTFISGYAPIKNSSGKVIAIVGVDKDFSSILYIRERVMLDIAIASVIILVLSILSASIFSKRITSNVNKIKDTLKAMKQGDLTLSLNINSKDEIQTIAEEINSFRIQTAQTLKMVKELSDVVTKQSENLSVVSEEMSSSSEAVASSIEEVSRGSSQQAEELANISNIVNDFGFKVDKAVQATDEINTKMNSINTKAIDSNSDLKALENSIRDINTAFTDVREKIQELGVNLAKVNEITNLIESISNQTNLLALNAAIEAARVGENGRGFAVVAEEIRKLAEQSKLSSSNINDLIKAISDDSKLVVETSEQMDEKMTHQMHIINKSMVSFKDIIENIEEIIPKFTGVDESINVINNEKENIIKSVEITAMSAEEVSTSTEEITAAIEELTASSEEVASSSLDLNNKAEAMIEAINKFKI